jgi:hypothetical protein
MLPTGGLETGSTPGGGAHMYIRIVQSNYNKADKVGRDQNPIPGSWSCIPRGLNMWFKYMDNIRIFLAAQIKPDCGYIYISTKNVYKYI